MKVFRFKIQSLKDKILASEITGYYFTEWGKDEHHPLLNPSHIVVQDSNHFTITPNGNGDLTNQGLYVVYKTRITAPVIIQQRKLSITLKLRLQLKTLM